MAVGGDYLYKIMRAVRIKTATPAVQDELMDIIEMARADLVAIGIRADIAADESNYNVLNAVRCYARWKMAYSPEEAVACAEEYAIVRDEMRRMAAFTAFTITFSITAGGMALPDADVTFNGETKATDADGLAAFMGVSAGTNQEYTVEAESYVAYAADLDVATDATVSVVMTT